MNLLQEDFQRYPEGVNPPKFWIYYRKQRESRLRCIRRFYRRRFYRECKKNLIEIGTPNIGGGMFINHPYLITINKDAVLGRNINIHKGVTIGQENRGSRKGAPVIGDNVWIGVNATIVGKINVGNDVLIAPNTYVNCNIPDHSVVFGNPCVIKHADYATEGYINRVVKSAES